MPTFGVKLEPGFTREQYRAALLSICTQAWGAYTLLNPQSGGYWLDHRYIEWPDFKGRKHTWYNTNGSNFNAQIASQRTPAGSNWNYQNLVGTANITSDPSNKTVAYYLIALGTDDYRALSIVSSAVQSSHMVGEFKGPAPYWGTSDRVFLTTDVSLFNTLPGHNPFGVLNSSGVSTTAGRTTYNVNSRNSTQENNPVTGKREVRTNDSFIDDLYGVVGYMPRDIGIAASSGIGASVPVIYDCDPDGLFVSFNTVNTARWAIKVDAAPIAGLTVYPSALYDFGDPPEGVYSGDGETDPTEPGECEPEWPGYGQRLPNPRALKMRQVTP